MSYTIADLDSAVEVEDAPWGEDYGSEWNGFEEAIQSDLEPILDAEGNPVMEPDSYNPSRSYAAYRAKGWTGVDLPGIGRVTLKDIRGGEGQGDEYFIVIAVEDADGIRYFKRTGWYASFDGSELNDGVTYEVEQAEKTIKYWKQIK